MTLREHIAARIARSKADWVFTPADFADLGTPHAIGMVLFRMVKAGKLRRLARGLYDVPRIHPELGELSASSGAIAGAIARRDGISIQPTEAEAANLLHLSEQVPARVVYHTDGRRRVVKVGKRTIEFRHRSGRKMAEGMNGLVMSALRSLGPQHVTNERVAHLRKLLKTQDRERLLSIQARAPAWMRPYLRFIAGENSPA